MDTLAGGALVALFYGLTGLWGQRHVEVDRRAEVIDEGRGDAGWMRVQSSARDVARPSLAPDRHRGRRAGGGGILFAVTGPL